SQNCPCAGRRFLIRLQQPEHQAHSQRSPISTESHHEIGLQTADTYPQNSWSLWSYCFIYPPMFIFHSREA
ncbi:hypothetical protein F7725_001936, partial [Dissostichus mawsoni]